MRGEWVSDAIAMEVVPLVAGGRYCAVMPHQSLEQNHPIVAAYVAIGHMDADELVALCDPEVRFESQITELEDAAYQGHEGAKRFIANLVDAFKWISVETFDVVADRDRAAITNRFRACGRGSGVQIEKLFFVAAEARKGRLLWWQVCDSRAGALKAAGLSE